jgi:hypothetical protein
MLGGTATLSTHKDGKASRHMIARVLSKYFIPGGLLSGMAVAMIFLGMKWPEHFMKFVMLAIVFILLGGVCVMLGALDLAPETVEMGRDYLRVTRRDRIFLDIPWASVRELRSTTEISHGGRRRYAVEPVVKIASDAGKYTMEWWRYTVDERKQFFLFVASRVMPSGTRIMDELRWLPAQNAFYPSLTSGRASEYSMLVKAGLGMMLAGAACFVGFFVNLPMLGAIGAMLLFIGFLCAVGGSAGKEEERKRDRQKGI